jgi:hypothetical protein
LELLGREMALRHLFTPTTTSKHNLALNPWTRAHWIEVRKRSVAAMEDRRDWDVTVRPRIEGVTGQEAFPEMLRAALAAETGLSTLQVHLPTVPHSTSVVVRVSAASKMAAEGKVRDFVLDVLLSVARKLVGEEALGWTLGIDAAPSRDLSDHR